VRALGKQSASEPKNNEIAEAKSLAQVFSFSMILLEDLQRMS
jgi:hypothetical protein